MTLPAVSTCCLERLQHHRPMENGCAGMIIVSIAFCADIYPRRNTVDFSLDHNIGSGELMDDLYPLHHSAMNFEINAHAGAYTLQHVDASGLGTYVHMLHGTKIWVVKKPKPRCMSICISNRFRLTHPILAEQDSNKEGESPQSQDPRLLSAKDYDLVAVVLKAGDFL